MSYSITLLDARAEWATVFVAPDSAVEVTRRKVVTNFQHQIEWPEHARATRAQERLACLQQHIDAKGPLQSAVDALLQPPLFQSAWLRGYGTLYSAFIGRAAASSNCSGPGSAGRKLLMISPKANARSSMRLAVMPSRPEDREVMQTWRDPELGCHESCSVY